MSIGFTFAGTVKDPDALAKTAQRLAEERHYRLYPGENGLNIALCPLDGTLYISWKKEDGLLKHYAVEGQCFSTPAGPGLHQAAVELLDGLDLQGLRVDDETGYYDHRDFGRMCAEHFHPWLKTLVEIGGRKLEEGEYANLCLCWDMNQYKPADVPGTAVAPLGRFGVRWMKETVENRGIGALAERFFLWYHPGAQDALFHRSLALNLLWERCYFAPSARSGEDAGINGAILDNLERAARLDPALPLPRRAYAEVCALAGRAPALPDGPDLEEEFEPGFRKGLVVHPIGSLRLTLPGRFLYEWEEWDENSGCHLWWDTEDGPVWRVNAYHRRSGNAAFTPVLEGDNDLTELEVRGGAVRYGWRTLDGENGAYFQVRAEAVTGGDLFVITVTHTRAEERAGIAELIRAITAENPEVQKHTVQAEG